MIEFKPRADCRYKYDYQAIFADIAAGKVDAGGAYRALVLDDLWFIVYFILEVEDKGVGVSANHPFVVEACQEVENGSKDYTLDVWAREHFKSTIITIAETIQYQLKNPGHATGIFSYAKKVSKKFLYTIREVFERSEVLKQAFPDILWKEPEKEAPLWSLDEGIILKRDRVRKEPSVSAWGLIEGMPTGMHFDRRVYDDIVTEDIAESVEYMEKVKTKFDSSQNLGTVEGTHRVVGTFYHHNDPLVYIRDKKRVEDGGSLYKVRLKPATEDGTPNGKPVLLPEKRFKALQQTRTFNCQQLCNPTPVGVRKLDSSYMKVVKAEDVPIDVVNFMVIDPAGDDKTGKGDAWAILVVAVEPEHDNIGASNIYIADAVISPLSFNEAIEQIVRMYLKGGIIEQVGVEKVGISTIEIHVANALMARGRHISVDDRSLVILRPAGRSKVRRIESALSWPLVNEKVHISESVPAVYRDRLRMEMDKFPYWHDDALDALSYLYDMIRDYDFPVTGSRYAEYIKKAAEGYEPLDGIAGY